MRWTVVNIQHTGTRTSHLFYYCRLCKPGIPCTVIHPSLSWWMIPYARYIIRNSPSLRGSGFWISALVDKSYHFYHPLCEPSSWWFSITHHVGSLDLFITNIGQCFTIVHIKYKVNFISILTFVLVQIATFKSALNSLRWESIDLSICNCFPVLKINLPHCDIITMRFADINDWIHLMVRWFSISFPLMLLWIW